MNVSWNWLQNYVDLSDLTPEEVAERMTLTSLEQDRIINTADAWNGVVVARILDVKKHPDADKLHVVTVDVGDGATEDIVCGGSNISVDMEPANVPLATIGTKLGEIEINEAKIRGVVSRGMLCGPDELGEPAKDDRAIWILPEDLTPGTSLATALGRDDVMIDFDVLANRPDCMGHEGVAREIAAVFGRPFNNNRDTWPHEINQGPLLENAPTNDDTPLTVAIESDAVSQRYVGAVVSGVDSRPSPDWLQNALASVGQKSINALVDVTNYLMLDLAQPFHAFDYDRITGQTMNVRVAKQGETVRTLDGEDRELPEGAILIEDADGPMDLAGIMGGERTMVHDDTTRIVLQVAHFDATKVRQASRALGHRTDAVARYEKGVDIHRLPQALEKGLGLLQAIFPGATLERVIDEHGTLPEPKTVTLTNARLASYLGVELERETVMAILQRLELAVQEATDEQLVVQIPTFRPDLAIEEDLIEEVARIHGYEQLPFTYLHDASKPPTSDPAIKQRQRLRELLQGQGMNEVMNMAFVGPQDLKKIGIQNEPHVRVTNPLDERQSFLRIELLSGLLRVGKQNRRHTEKVSLFELGRVYYPHKRYTEDDPTQDEVEPREPWKLTLVEIQPKQTTTSEKAYRQMRGRVEQILETFQVPYRIQAYLPEKARDGEMHPGQAAIIRGETELLGHIYALHPSVMRAHGYKGVEVHVAVLYPESLFRFSGDKRYTAYSEFPSITRDIAVTVAESTTVQELLTTITQNGGEYLVAADLFDVFRDTEKLGEGNKSLAFHLSFQSAERTLKEHDIDDAFSAIEQVLQQHTTS